MHCPASFSRRSLFALALSAGLVLSATGCGKGAAEEALAAAGAAFDQAKPDIEKYVPADLKAINSDLSKARAAFDKGDYKGALAAGQKLVPRIQAAWEAARKKKDELAAAFASLQTSVPALLDSLKKKLGQLAKSESLPAGLDQATVEAAQANLESVGKSWADAVSKFDSGDVTTAMAQANELKTQVEEMAKAFLPATSGKK